MKYASFRVTFDSLADSEINAEFQLNLKASTEKTYIYDSYTGKQSSLEELFDNITVYSALD
jgi:hypothetical protein